ncbi:MAG: DinB family protein [Candidatus Hodarchaeales archaeon]|jgi:uncharacterized damage-inducible protein DinB
MSTLENKKEELNKKLSRIRNDFLELIGNLSIEEQNQRISPKEESWTILDTVKHLYEAEDGMTRLMTGILGGSEGVPQDFDLNRWNRRIVEKMTEKTLEMMLSGLKDSRQRLLDFLMTLEEPDFERKGRHGTLKVMTIEEILNLIGDHEKNHLDKIKDALQR